MRVPDPIQYASGYSLDLYCDQDKHPPAIGTYMETFTGETFGQCARDARRKGWVIHKDQTSTCPFCNRK